MKPCLKRTGFLLQNSSDSFLNFDKDHLITGINVIKLTDTAHLLYWTDNFNQPRKINIEKGKFFMQSNYTLGYKAPFDPIIINRIKQPPLFPPTYTWTGGNIGTQVINTTFAGSSTLSNTSPTQILFTQNPPNSNFNHLRGVLCVLVFF